jgi:hypothetical protein
MFREMQQNTSNLAWQVDALSGKFTSWRAGQICTDFPGHKTHQSANPIA